ncbi:TPA: hypothetical protein ACIO27_004618, partial [Salmonella enterica subsp. enterica serovar Reading]
TVSLTVILHTQVKPEIIITKKRPASMLAFLVRQVGTQKSIVLSLTYLAKVASRLFALALDFMLMEAV